MEIPADFSLDTLQLGEHDQEIKLASSDDNRRVAAALVSQTHRTLEIFTRDLEAELYDQPEFLEGLKQLALHSKYVQIRILLQDASRCIRDGHRIIEMMRRLSTFIEIRQPHYDYREHNEAFLVADGTGVLHRRLADRYEGVACFKMPLRARELTNFFDEVWQRSEAHPDLRRLHL